MWRRIRRRILDDACGDFDDEYGDFEGDESLTTNMTISRVWVPTNTVLDDLFVVKRRFRWFRNEKNLPTNTAIFDDPFVDSGDFGVKSPENDEYTPFADEYGDS